MRDNWLIQNGSSVKIWSDERFYDYSEYCPEIQAIQGPLDVKKGHQLCNPKGSVGHLI